MRLYALPLALVVAASPLGCRARAPARASRGVATRVVSLAPSATEVLYALGAGDRVVGVSIFDDYPPEATRKPRVGGIVNPSFEAIAALRPDALVGVQGPIDRGVLGRVEAMGVRLEFPRVESIDEVLASVDRFAALVGRVERGAALRASIRRELDAVSRSVAGRPRVRVVAAFSAQPLVVAGRGSWVDEVLRVAGGENVIDTGARYPTVSVEVILGAAPDVVLDLSPEMGTSALSSALSAHGALRSSRCPDGGAACAPTRVITLRDGVFLRPGPRVGEAARRLALALHPGLAQ
ncbi:MAG: helical backbone metal receptor [Polyangiales bacterium]